MGDEAYTRLAEMLRRCDGFVIGSPVYFAGPNGALCALLDRIFCSMSDELRGKPACAVVNCRRGGASAAFDRLNKYFTISNMNVIGSQYWNQVHGGRPEDVRKDEEGLQTMRTLARNMAYQLRAKEAAVKAELPMPEFERPCMTNFIR